jgi:hypothetical protein
MQICGNLDLGPRSKLILQCARPPSRVALSRFLVVLVGDVFGDDKVLLSVLPYSAIEASGPPNQPA